MGPACGGSIARDLPSLVPDRRSCDWYTGKTVYKFLGERRRPHAAERGPAAST